MLLSLLLACTPPPPTEAEALRWAEQAAPALRELEGVVGAAVEERFPRFTCRPPDGTQPVPDKPACIAQRAAWERGRLGAVAQLQPVLESSIDGEVIGLGVLVAGLGSASAGVRPTPTMPAEQGPRQDLRWVGWGADRGGPFVETLRKLSVQDTDVAIRIVSRPPPGP
jgi:hypothetical protein